MGCSSYHKDKKGENNAKTLDEKCLYVILQ